MKSVLGLFLLSVPLLAQAKFGMPDPRIFLPASGGDDTARLQAVCTALYGSQGVMVLYPQTYHLNTGGFDCYGPISIEGNGATIIGGGATGGQITVASCLSAGYTPNCPNAASVVNRTATGALTAGNFSLTLSNVTGLSVGDTVYMWLGDDPTDSFSHSLPLVQMFNTVSGIAGSVVSFSEPVPVDVPDPSTIDGFSGRTHHVWKPQGIAENITISNLSFVRDLSSGNPGYRAFSVQFARNVSFSRLRGSNLGYALLGVNYGTNYSLESISCDHMIYTTPGDGNCLDGWSMNQLAIRDFSATDVNGQAISFEGQNRGVIVDGGRFTQSQSGTAFRQFVGFAGNSQNVVGRNLEFTAAAASVFSAFGSTNDGALLENIKLNGNVHQKLTNVTGFVSYGSAIAKTKKTWSKAFQITPNMTTVQIFTPQGWYSKAWVYVSSTTGITLFQFTNNNGGVQVQGQLLSGKSVEVGHSASTLAYLGPEGNDPFNNNPDGSPAYGKYIHLSTNGTVPANTWGLIEIEYFPIEGVVDELPRTSPF